MTWLVVLAEMDLGTLRAVQVFGPYDSEPAAEAGRRRVHFDHVTEQPYWLATQRRTFVAEMGDPQ